MKITTRIQENIVSADEANYNLRLRHPDAMAVMQEWKERSRLLRNDLPGTLDIPYGQTPSEYLDIFSAQPKAPVLLFIHGGYWQGGDKSDVSFIARLFVQAGISVVLINYGLAPQTNVEMMVSQAAKAVRWVHENAAIHGLDAERIHVMGHSAGGHLAAMLLSNFPGAQGAAGLVRSATAISGLFDLQPLINTSWNSALQLDSERAMRLSPACLQRKSEAPLLTLVGAQETSGFMYQMDRIDAGWSNVHKLAPVPDKHHYNVLDIFDDEKNPWLQRLLTMITGPRTAPMQSKIRA